MFQEFLSNLFQHPICVLQDFVINEMIHESNSDLIFIIEGSAVIITELTPPGFRFYSNTRKGIRVLFINFLNIKLENMEAFRSFQCTKVAVADITILCICHPPP